MISKQIKKESSCEVHEIKHETIKEYMLCILFVPDHGLPKALVYLAPLGIYSKRYFE